MGAESQSQEKILNFLHQKVSSPLRHAVEHAYSRGIFREADNLLIHIHNHIPIALLDVILAGGVVNIFLKSPRLSAATDWLINYGLIHLGCYEANRGRKPLEETLELRVGQYGEEEKRFDDWLDRDIEYVGKRIRELPEVIDLSQGHISPIEEAVRGEIARIEGKDPGAFPRLKKHSLVAYFLDSYGALGSYSVISPEIILSPTLADEDSLSGMLAHDTVAHEMVHTKGYIREKEVELIAHLAMMHSGSSLLIAD